MPSGYDTTPADLKTNDQIVSVLDGIKAAVPNATVNYAQGCTLHRNGHLHVHGRLCRRPSPPRRPPTVTVVVVGEPASDSGEASSRSNIDLPGQQHALVQRSPPPASRTWSC